MGSQTQYHCIVNIKNISICTKNIVSLIIINIVNIKNIIIIIIILINSIDIKNIIICLINIIIIIIIINNIINKIIYKFEKKNYQYEKNRINSEGKIKNYYYYH